MIFDGSIVMAKVGVGIIKAKIPGGCRKGIIRLKSDKGGLFRVRVW